MCLASYSPSTFLDLAIILSLSSCTEVAYLKGRHEAIHNKNMRIPHPQNNLGPSLPPALCYILANKWGVFSKVVIRFQNLVYDFWGVGEMFEGDSADTVAGKFPLMLKGRLSGGFQ
jgi:hypothetical protein